MATTLQITRLLLIIRKINSGKNVTAKTLLDHVNNELILRGYQAVSQRSIERDIETIRKPPFGMNIKNEPVKGYYIGESNYYGLDIEQLLEPFDILNALNADSGLSEFIHTDKHRNKGTEHLYKLITAIKGCYKISFNYSKYLSEEFIERSLEPYAIKLVKGQWYVVGKTAAPNEVKTFGLDRISDLLVSKQPFKKDPSVNIKEKFQYSFGIYSDDEFPIQDVILSFDHQDWNYLQSVPLHSSQEVVDQNDKEIIIKLRLRITIDFVMAILSRSSSLKVIEPASLREKVSEIYKAALERNRL